MLLVVIGSVMDDIPLVESTATKSFTAAPANQPSRQGSTGLIDFGSDRFIRAAVIAFRQLCTIRRPMFESSPSFWI